MISRPFLSSILTFCLAVLSPLLLAEEKPALGETRVARWKRATVTQGGDPATVAVKNGAIQYDVKPGATPISLQPAPEH